MLMFRAQPSATACGAVFSEVLFGMAQRTSAVLNPLENGAIDADAQAFPKRMMACMRLIHVKDVSEAAA